MGVLLYFVATLLYIPLSIINILIVLYKNVRKHGFFRVINKYLFNEAIRIDIFANESFETLWNTTLRIKGGYKFGKRGETISSALGKNKLKGTLSWLGELVADILDFLDENHCIKSINDPNFNPNKYRT